jgi:hypothetical protein
MNATVARMPPARRLGTRVWGGIVAAWAVVTGVAPHVLHHVGPLAGAALLAGAGGKAIFFAIGLLLSVPMLRRLYRRFGTLVAPAVAIAVFAAVFIFSSLVIAPKLTGSQQSQQPGIQQPAPSDRARHHSGGGR